MGSTPELVGSYKSVGVSLTSGHATRPARVLAGGSRGSRVHQLLLSSSDSSSNTAVLYHGQQMTLQSAMGSAAHADNGGSPDTITRSSGSFVTDGWKVGDLLFVHGSTTLANDYLARVTAVAALTLSVATGTAAGSEALPAGAVLYKATKLGVVAVAANAGDASGVVGVDLLQNTGFPDLDASPNRYRVVGPNNALLVAVGTTLGAAEFVDVTAGYGDY